MSGVIENGLSWEWDKDSELWMLRYDTDDDFQYVEVFGEWQAELIAGKLMPALPEKEKV